VSVTVAAISVGARIALFVFIITPFLGLTLFELVTGRIDHGWAYYRFWQREPGKPHRE
jgi:hypothetical protein